MITTFTQNDLIRFLYHETSEQENEEIKRALQFDSELSLQFDELQLVARNLNASLIEPSQGVVERILSYSARL